MKRPGVKFCVLVLLAFAAFVSTSTAQRRDYLNEKEADLVRENQQVGLRIDILTKAIDRRFMVLNAEAEGKKDWQKSSELWGDMPTGTRLALFTDIERLLQKAIDDIDDIAAHDRMDSKFFPKAMRALAASADRYKPMLKTALDKTKDEKESATLMTSIEFCDQIGEALAKVPPEVKESKKKKEKKSSN